MSAKVAEIFDSMEYGPAPETEKTALEWLAQKDNTIGHFINGKWAVPSKSKWFDTINPATGDKLAKIACGTTAEVDAAVKAAKTALKKWQAMDGHGRAIIAACRPAPGGPAAPSRSARSSSGRTRTAPRRSGRRPRSPRRRRRSSRPCSRRP